MLHHSSNLSSSPEPVADKSVDEILDVYQEAPESGSAWRSCVSKLSQFVINGGPDGEKVLNTMMEWLGADAICGPTSGKACVVLFPTLLELPADRLSKAVNRLKELKNDEDHPYREIDASDMIRRLDVSEEHLCECWDKGLISESVTTRYGAICSIGETVSSLLQKNEPAKSRELMKRYTPDLLRIIGRGDNPADLSFTLACNLFKEWVVRDPEVAVELLIDHAAVRKDSCKSEEKLKADFEFLGAFILLTWVLPPEIKNMTARITDSLFKDQDHAGLGFAILSGMQEVDLDSLLGSLDKSDSFSREEKFWMITKQLPSFQDDMLSKVVKFIKEGGGKEACLGFGLLVGFAREVHKGASNREDIKRLTRFEKILRGEELGKLLERSKAHGFEAEKERALDFEAMLQRI